MAEDWRRHLFRRDDGTDQPDPYFVMRPADPPRPTPRATLADAAPQRPADARSGAAPAATTASTAPATDATGDQALRADLARARFGVTGAGVKIGILSDSFDRLGGAAADVARGDLPAGGVTVLEEGPASGHDEGRAMADLIHRIAPGAQLLFHTAMAGETDFAAGIAALQQAGCTIIVDDVAYFDEPFYQDGGLVQRAVERAVASGVSYFTAAGNEGRDYLEARFTPWRGVLPGLPGATTAADLGGGGGSTPYARLTVPVGGACLLDLQWDQPFTASGGGGGSTDSLALVLYDQWGRVVAASGHLAVGSDPVQTLRFTNTTPGTAFSLAVVANAATLPPDLFKVVAFGQGTLGGPLTGAGSGSLLGHELVPGVNTVGAIDYAATPRFGGSGAVETYSSTGPGVFLLDDQGNRLATPLTAGKVDFVAPDGGLTSVFTPFYGTSAAAPNAAAVAALMLQENPHLSPAQVTWGLEQSAAALPGGHDAAGAGLIQADQAVALAATLLWHA